MLKIVCTVLFFAAFCWAEQTEPSEGGMPNIRYFLKLNTVISNLNEILREANHSKKSVLQITPKFCDIVFVCDFRWFKNIIVTCLILEISFARRWYND